jgi:hypothetical protein
LPAAQPSKQVAERALRGEGGARPLDRAGVVAPSAFDTTIGTGASWCLCGDGGLFHCIQPPAEYPHIAVAAISAMTITIKTSVSAIEDRGMLKRRWPD